MQGGGGGVEVVGVKLFLCFFFKLTLDVYQGIGHYDSRYNELGTLLKEAVAVFPNTELAAEGKVFEL